MQQTQYRQFEQNVRDGIEDGTLFKMGHTWKTHGTVSAETKEKEFSLSLGAACYRIMSREEESAHGFFTSEDEMKDIMDELMDAGQCGESNLHRLYSFVNNRNNPDGKRLRMRIDYCSISQYGVVQNDYDEKLKVMKTSSYRAVFEKNSKNRFGFNVVTFYPETNARGAKEMNINLIPYVQMSSYFNSLTPEKQTYWWSAANPTIDGRLSFDEGRNMMTLTATEDIAVQKGRYLVNIPVDCTLEITEDGINVFTSQGENFDLLNDDDLDAFREKFPTVSSSFDSAAGQHEELFFRAMQARSRSGYAEFPSH